jgi:hypothetical protein
MDGSVQYGIVLKSIASTQMDFLPQHKLFLCGYAALKLY